MVRTAQSYKYGEITQEELTGLYMKNSKQINFVAYHKTQRTKNTYKV